MSVYDFSWNFLSWPLHAGSGLLICSLPMNGQVEWRAWTAIYYYFSFGGVRARWVGCVGDLGEAQGEIRGSVWTTGVRALVS